MIRSGHAMSKTSVPVELVAAAFVTHETLALLTRLERVKPFVLYETMLPAAAPPLAAQVAIERFLASNRSELRRLARQFLQWLGSIDGRRSPPREIQRRFALLRLRFNDLLSQFDVFADVITQRSERDNGVWLSGLEVVAADAMALPGGYYDTPPVVCYLRRGYGASIRRALTRLPGGGSTPVAIIQVPRERMVGSGVASSLVHEVGHQGAELLGLAGSLRPLLRGLQRGDGDAIAWQLWERWISEILADLWSVAMVGISGTTGLTGVVSLPRPFVFRVSLDDPHPIPWIRVKLSAALGEALYPDPQWSRFAATWEALYPRQGLPTEGLELLARLERSIPAFVSLLVNYRPRSLRGNSLQEVLSSSDRRPANLRARFTAWDGSRLKMQGAPPTLVFAVIGQAKADGRLSPEQEGRMLADLLTDWAMRSALDMSAICATAIPSRNSALKQHPIRSRRPRLSRRLAARREPIVGYGDINGRRSTSPRTADP
jgi:hypothetical protein